MTNLKNSLAENDVVGPLVSKTLTLDQAKAVMTYVDVLNEGKSLSILFLQASRGRVSLNKSNKKRENQQLWDSALQQH